MRQHLLVQRATARRSYLINGLWLVVFLLGLTAAFVAVAALRLVVNNPAIDDTSKGDNYSCAAPYDTVILRNDNIPGGEPPEDSDSIAARCARSGEVRFSHSAALWAGAYLLVSAAVGADI